MNLDTKGFQKKEIPTQTANPSGGEIATISKAIFMPILRQKTIKVNDLRRKNNMAYEMEMVRALIDNDQARIEAI